jgi:hypothetical protein
LTPASLDIQQARIKHILFKSQLRSVLYGVREPTEALFSMQGNALAQWLQAEVKPLHGSRPEMREAERVMRQILNTGRDLVAQYQRGQIEEARRGLSQVDAYGEQLLALLQQLPTNAAPGGGSLLGMPWGGAAG